MLEMPTYTPPDTVLVMPDQKTSGQRVREIRERLGFSYRQAGDATGLSHGTIQQLEQRIGRWDGVQNFTLEKLARGYGVSRRTIQLIAEDRDPDESKRAALEALEAYRVHPDYLVFPLYGSVSAGDAEPEPIEDGVVYIPREHLRRKGANPETVRTYVVSGRCMVSEEARRIEKNFAPRDYVAVDYDKGYEVGDTVVAWWDDRSVMVIKRYGVEIENIILYPIAPGHPSLVLPNEDDVQIIGPVVWRGG